MTKKLFMILTAGIMAAGSAAIAANAPETVTPPAAAEKTPAPEEKEQKVTDPRSRQLASILAASRAADREGRIDHLFEALEILPEDTEVILKHLSEDFGTGTTAAPLLKRFDALWEKRPDSLIIATYGSELHTRAGESTDACRLIAMTLKAISPETAAAEAEKLLRLRQNYLGHLANCNDFAAGREMIEKVLADCTSPLLRGGLLETAAEFYRTAALRLEGFRLPADDWINSTCTYRKLYAESLFELRKTDAALDDGTVSGRIAFYLAHKRNDFALSLASDLADRKPTLSNRVLYFRTAISAGEVVLCEKILDSLLKNVKLAPNAIAAARVEVRINAGDHAGAKELIDRNSTLPEVGAMEVYLYLKSNDAKGLLRLANASWQSGGESRVTALQLLIAAEKLKDRTALKQARSVLDDIALNDHDTANSVGYICAVLGVDLDHAEKLITYAVEEAPFNAAYLDSLAFLRFRQGKLEEADKLIHKALSLVTPLTGAAVIIEHAGDIALSRGRRDEALSRYRYALNLAGEDSNLDAGELQAKISKLTEKK